MVHSSHSRSMLRVLIVDDHPLVRKGLHELLRSHHPDWEIFEADNGIRAILTAADVRPDLILMDYVMPKLDGVKASSAIKRDLPRSKIIMITMSDPENIIMNAIEAGVNYIISKNAPFSEILSTIAEITNENANEKEEITKNSPRTGKKGKVTDKKKHLYSLSYFLTDREMEVVKFMMKGYTSRRISEQLSLSVRTVEGHRSKILKKCDLHSTPEMFNFLLKNKLLPHS
ncbi:MAG: response regulator transcription factor [Bacteroidetes bacterium]|nr:response regulator transcription factor [Bacteroidota bacterium]